ncbi:MAG: transglutaminase-like domain-containing protein [Candidatus Aenigmatarchaeota archaeon]
MFEPPKGYEKYCEPTFLCESNLPEIKELAQALAKDKKTPEEAARAFFYWVRDNVAWKVEEIVGAKETLKRNPMHGVCADKANLFIALCRAVGIPARYLLIFRCQLNAKVKDFPKKVGHVAAEVYLNNEWKVVDPTFGKDTEKLIPLSEFDRPSWKRIAGVLRVRELSVSLALFSMLILRFSRSSLKMKELIESLRK